MGFFSKRKDENNGFIINTDDEPIKISGDKNMAPHAMTPEEVSGGTPAVEAMGSLTLRVKKEGW